MSLNLKIFGVLKNIFLQWEAWMMFSGVISENDVIIFRWKFRELKTMRGHMTPLLLHVCNDLPAPRKHGIV